MNTHMKKIGSRRAGYRWMAAWPAVAVTGAIAVPVAIAMSILSQSASAAAAPVGLGTASSYAVLAGSTVTNTGPSVISGNVGVSPGTAVTGFPPGTVNSGTIHAADAAAANAQADLTTAYNDAAGRVKSASIGGFIGGGQTLAPGVYNATSSLAVGGSLTLDAQGDPNAVFIFQAGSTLGTATGTTILLTNGAQACNVFWQVGSSATLTTGSTFQGTILALTSITVQTGDTITGRALARNGAVTLDDDTIIVPSCTTGTGPTPSSTGPTPTGTGTGTGPTPTGTGTGPTPTGTGPTPTGTGTGPTPTGTGTGPTPTGTGPIPTPTGTGPTPNLTSPAPTPTGTSPAPTPTGTSPTRTAPTPAPTPTPVGTPFPVTG
jgi:type VI secretion system secreted protein VgrG